MINPTQIDIIGAIDGSAGWHVNVPGADMTPSLEGWRVAPGPATPLRVYAGDAPPFPHTAFLRFPDEATARSTLGVDADA